MQQVKHVFSGGMNNDDAAEAMGQDVYLNAQNLRFGKKKFGDNRRLEAIESTRIITNRVTPAGTNLPVGRCIDSARDRTFLFFFNSLGEHNICVLQKDETILLVIKSSNTQEGLKFKKNKRIHSVEIIGDLLYWINDDIQYKINVEAALKATNISYPYANGYDFSTPIKATVYSLIKRPPNYLVTAQKVTNATIKVNQTRDIGFRFTYWYEYRDGEESTLAAHSLLVPANRKAETFNAIDIKISFAEKIEQDVTAINLVVIYATEDKFFSIKRWNKENITDLAEITAHNAGTTNLTYQFSNNTIGESVADVKKVKPFDSVPVNSSTLALVKNRLFLGDNTSGYNTPKTTSLAFSVITALNTTNPSGEWQAINVTYYFNNLPNGTENGYLLYLPITYGIFASGYYYKESEFGNNAGPGSVTLNDFTWIYIGMYDNMPVELYNRRMPSFLYTSFDPAFTFILRTDVLLADVTTSVTGNGTSLLKSGSSYYGGVVFYDRYMRQCGVTVSKNAFITTPERAYSDFTSFNYGVGFTLTSGALPLEIPEYAHYYSVVMSKCLRTDFFCQARAFDIRYAVYDSITAAYTVTSQTYSVSQSGIAVQAKSLYAYGMGYTYNPGDILKIFVGTDIYEVGIKAVQGEWVIGELIKIGTTGSLVGVLALFEIYTPIQTAASSFYFEVGNMFAVTNAGTNTRQYSATIGTLAGDVFLIDRGGYLTENMNPNDTIWKEWNTCHGRVQIIDNIGQQYKPTSLAFSSKYIPGTRVNGLNSFEALNEELLPSEMVRVRRLLLTNKVQQEGSVLLAIGEDETMAVYIGETQVQDVNGSAYVAQSTNVIGTVNPLRGGYGTRHPESADALDGIAFWYDVVRGKVIQYSSAGLDAVSKYKLYKFWNDWSLEYKSKPDTYWTDDNRAAVNGVIDQFTGEYQIQLPRLRTMLTNNPTSYDPNDGEKKTMVFNYEENKWVGSFNYSPSMFFSLNNTFYSLIEKDVAVHDVNQTTVNLYGINYPCRLMLAETAGNFDATKAWNTIALIANAAPDYVAAETDLPYTQKTDLLKTEFRDVEGKYYASWKRNTISSTMTAGVALLNGEKMRGQTMYVTIEYRTGAGTVTRQNRIFINSVYFGVFLSNGQTV